MRYREKDFTSETLILLHKYLIILKNRCIDRTAYINKDFRQGRLHGFEFS